MPTLQVRNLSEATHKELRVRAIQANQSLSDYVASQLDSLTAVPSIADVYARLDQWGPTAEDAGAAELLRQERDSR